MKTKAILILFIISTFQVFAEDFKAVNKGRIIYYNIISAANLTLEVTYKGTDYDVHLNEYTTAITIPDSIKHLGKTYVVTKIGKNAFRDCERLNSIVIPPSVKIIDTNAFSDCKALHSASLPATLEIIEQNAFSGCEGMLAITLPAAITEIKERTFLGCSKLNNVSIPASVKRVYDEAFAACAIDTMFVPANTVYISESAFNKCKNLRVLEVDTLNKFFTSIDGMLFNKSVTQLLRCPEGIAKLSIPDSITTIGNYAFNGCDQLLSIQLPEKLSAIEAYAFSGCSKLSSFVIPEVVNYLGDGVFKGCSALTSISIPLSVQIISENAFYNCKALPEITIPSSVKEIGKQAFYGFMKLKNVYVDQLKPAECDENSFDSRNTYGSTLHVPVGGSLIYKEAIGWRVFYNVIEDVQFKK
jgi:hypothetical protein